MKKIALVLVAYIFTVLNALSQTNMIPTMKSGIKNDVELSKLDIDVVISGNLATTTFDMIFTNYSNVVLEGEFEFPLGEGQTVSRYALDVNGKLREGVVVEKEKARKTFEEIERRNVDPGILEQTAGNNFRTRIYPFNPQKSRHVVIAYEQELNISDGKVFYKLPLLSDKEIEDVSMNVTITGNKVEPIFKRIFQKNAHFTKNGKSYNYNFAKKKYKFAEGIEIELPLKMNDGAQVYVENDNFGSYFSIFDLIEKESSNPKPKAKTLTVIYDVSSSASNFDKELNKQIILAYLKNQNISYFRLVTFSNTIHSDKVYSKAEFINEFKKLNYDGATNFGCIDLNKYDCDEILLFSDGLGNIGGEEPVYGKTPVDIINSSNISNHSFLKMIAQKTHGKYINTQTTDKKSINTILANNSLEVIDIEYDPEVVSEVYPSTSHQVTNHLSIAGKLNKKEATIKVTLGYGGQPIETRTYNVSAVSSDTLKNIKRIWAQKKLNELDVNYKKNQKEISRLSKNFSIVTRNTSFIVLESVHDYVRYEITPPEELMDEYNRILGNRNKYADPDNKNKIPEKVFHAMNEFHNKYKHCEKITIQGVVTDGKKPLSGVKVSADSISSTTDINGHYEMLVYCNSNIKFSLDGYFSEIVKVGDNSNDAFNVTLYKVKEVTINSEEIAFTEDDRDAEVEELVVTGYGVQERSDVTGSVSSSSDSGYRRQVVRKSSKNENRSQEHSDNNPSGIRQEIKFWSPDNDYIKELRRTESKDMYEKYLQLKNTYLKSPSFYLDVSSYFAEEGMIENAIRIVSNVSEIDLEEAETARSCAKKLMEFKDYSLAASVFERIIEMRGEEPHSYRDLAQAYIKLERYQEAADLLYKAGTGNWDSRFKNSQQISLNELGSLIALHPGKIDTTNYDQRLLENFPLDLRIILTWNTDNSDIDLWVIDPNNEKCYYRNKKTKLCGWISDDITRGYGPEEFCLIDAINGDYKIYANYYGSTSQKTLQPVVVQATIYTNFGRPNQDMQIMTLQLENANDSYLIGTITFEK
ncbi:MAG: DUF2135 domain-containing protein [Paludibacteraceae bacterium]|nr:DUF2135 domain-containing protein [Paludibacteraceae bacterium]